MMGCKRGFRGIQLLLVVSLVVMEKSILITSQVGRLIKTSMDVLRPVREVKLTGSQKIIRFEQTIYNTGIIVFLSISQTI